MKVISEKTEPGLIKEKIESIQSDTEKYIQLCMDMNEESEQFSSKPLMFPSKIEDLSKDDILKVIEDVKIMHDIAKYILYNPSMMGKEEYIICKKILIHLSNKNNIVKKVCTELGITQKELAEKLATSKPTVERWSSTGEIPESSKKHLEILLENEELKKENQEIKKALSILKKYS